MWRRIRHQLNNGKFYFVGYILSLCLAVPLTLYALLSHEWGGGGTRAGLLFIDGRDIFTSVDGRQSQWYVSFLADTNCRNARTQKLDPDFAICEDAYWLSKGGMIAFGTSLAALVGALVVLVVDGLSFFSLRFGAPLLSEPITHTGVWKKLPQMLLQCSSWILLAGYVLFLELTFGAMSITQYGRGLWTMLLGVACLSFSAGFRGRAHRTRALSTHQHQSDGHQGLLDMAPGGQPPYTHTYDQPHDPPASAAAATRHVPSGGERRAKPNMMSGIGLVCFAALTCLARGFPHQRPYCLSLRPGLSRHRAITRPSDRRVVLHQMPQKGENASQSSAAAGNETDATTSDLQVPVIEGEPSPFPLYSIFLEKESYLDDLKIDNLITLISAHRTHCKDGRSFCSRRRQPLGFVRPDDLAPVYQALMICIADDLDIAYVQEGVGFDI
ncbi:unnamed protein product [Vitrella brassicaformis CCMP3155]|uniref:Uncharacterized protein n=2 Tax=Vitrella brassicaformis TaxID=1169539 RepID=A0A0G4ENV6_VITBC|nr:unnamed protein product [Vitrella brassicaformis CCMP3155]|eukprot:CEL99303.1 unnamed protein product [Vitrella brassicaformis CCMP3155]